jgi:hypothetical protein
MALLSLVPLAVFATGFHPRPQHERTQPLCPYVCLPFIFFMYLIL